MLRLRIANSGPEATPADAPKLLSDFAVYTKQAAINRAYPTPAGSEFYATVVRTNPVIPGTSADLVVARPQSAPPSGMRWGLLAHFSGAARLQSTNGTINFALGLQLQVSEDGALFVPLSTTLTGGAVKRIQGLAAGSDQYESFDLHAMRVFAGDTYQGAEGIIVQAAWGCPTADGNASFITGDEGESGGWDLTAGWVLTPINAVPPPSP